MGAVVTSSASAAFPGRDGLLAVQPLSGHGLVLVNSNGGRERRICTDRSRCGVPRTPRWSPDGRMLSFRSPNLNLIYVDGSCLNCRLSGGRSPAFTSNPSLFTFVSGRKLVEDGIDGIRKATILSAPVSDATFSAQGRLAVVRSGQVWVGSPGDLRRIGKGHSPSWSADGSRIAIARRGWVLVVRFRNRSTRRLVRGADPAWSPDGQSIAFIGAHHELRVVPASGGRARRVGHVRGVAVDWQPLPRMPLAGCITPPGSSTIARSLRSVVTSDSGSGGSAYMGCVLADGRERLLESFGSGNENSSHGVSAASSAGDYAALANSTIDNHSGSSSYTVEVFDLRTGAVVGDRGGETVGCIDYNGYSCTSNIDHVVVGSDGASAAHTLITDFTACTGLNSTCTLEAIVVSDGTGVHTLDTSNELGYGSSSLTGLGLSGDTLTWDHDGAPQSAHLREARTLLR